MVACSSWAAPVPATVVRSGQPLIWDPTLDAQVGDLDLVTEPRTGRHPATVLSDGRVYIAGGTGSDGEPLTTAEMYSPPERGFMVAPPSPDAASSPSPHWARAPSWSRAVRTGSRRSLRSTCSDRSRPSPTVVLRVRPACDEAQVLKGRGPDGLPVNNETGSLRTTKVQALRPDDRYGRSGAHCGRLIRLQLYRLRGLRWYRVRAVNGSSLGGWVAAQVLAGGARAFPDAPAMLESGRTCAGRATGIRRRDGRLGRCRACGDGHGHRADVHHERDRGMDVTARDPTRRQGRRFAPAVRGRAVQIRAADELVVIAYDVRRADPVTTATVRPGPCREHHGISIATLRRGSWCTERVARTGEHPSVATRDRHTYLANLR